MAQSTLKLVILLTLHLRYQKYASTLDLLLVF